MSPLTSLRIWFAATTACSAAANPVHHWSLGDVQALLARADELGLPTEKYAVRALPVDRSWRGHVYSISVEPYA